MLGVTAEQEKSLYFAEIRTPDISCSSLLTSRSTTLAAGSAMCPRTACVLLYEPLRMAAHSGRNTLQNGIY
jgi:hypothetical protein